MSLTRIDPPLPLVTPKGSGQAHFLIDRSQEHHLEWVVFIDETGECWTFQNPDVRLAGNLTAGRLEPQPQWQAIWVDK